MKKLNTWAATVLCAVLAACTGNDKEYDATGTFEATEVTVSAEQNGRLLAFDINEGDRVTTGQQVALIDTTQLYLKARQVGATKLVYASQRPDQSKQIAAVQQQLIKARQEQQRFAGLVKDGAANRKMLEDAESQVKVLERQLAALQSSLTTSTNSLNAQMGTADVQRLQVADELRKCHVSAPITGTVLDKYMERGEFAAIGKPLFKMADTDNMYLRAYVTTAQLKIIKIGQAVKVLADYGNGERKEYAGKVTWISAKSEFTPKTILTDDERADLVYAVKIAVKNDGYIKIGMYGEVKL
jgi:HlyD family secretion protein